MSELFFLLLSSLLFSVTFAAKILKNLLLRRCLPRRAAPRPINFPSALLPRALVILASA